MKQLNLKYRTLIKCCLAACIIQSGYSACVRLYAQNEDESILVIPPYPTNNNWYSDPHTYAVEPCTPTTTEPASAQEAGWYSNPELYRTESNAPVEQPCAPQADWYSNPELFKIESNAPAEQPCAPQADWYSDPSLYKTQSVFDSLALPPQPTLAPVQPPIEQAIPQQHMHPDIPIEEEKDDNDNDDKEYDEELSDNLEKDLPKEPNNTPPQIEIKIEKPVPPEQTSTLPPVEIKQSETNQSPQLNESQESEKKTQTTESIMQGKAKARFKKKVLVEGSTSSQPSENPALKTEPEKPINDKLVSQISVDEKQAVKAPERPPAVSHPVKKPEELKAKQEEKQVVQISPADIPQLPQRRPAPAAAATPPTPDRPTQIREISINFNNVSMIEYIRFISKISNKNFIFDDADLQFNVTIVSEEPTSVENLMTALLQELRIRNLSLIEQGNNIIIHRNERVRAPAHIVAPGTPDTGMDFELVTRVFRLNTLDPIKASEIIRPLLSDAAIVEVLRDSNNMIITDIVDNVNKIAQLISSLDAPNSGLTIGQYVVRNAFVDSLAILAERILQPIAQGNPFVLVPHTTTNSIFIVSNPFIVERALAILENLDINEGRTKIFSLDKLRLREDYEQPLPIPGQPGYPGQAGQPGQPGQPGQAGLAPGGLQPVPGDQFAVPGVPTTAVPGGALSSQGGTTIPGIPGLPGEFPSFQGGTLKDQGGTRIFEERREFAPGVLSSGARWIQDLPSGHIERTLFFTHKLRYRRGDQIEIALRKIAGTLQMMGNINGDLVAAINSIQWIESSNSLIFTGTAMALEKIRELIQDIDLPLRQVFIEMLVLESTVSDSLRYGVEWGSRFGSPHHAGSEAFLNSQTSPLIRGLDDAQNLNPFVTLDPRQLVRSEGFNLGVIGRHITRDGTVFNTIGALVTAVHIDGKTKIILNPKLIAEDNHTAEIFVGETTRYKTQSIANEQGNVITNNFQFLDVGTTLRVTPLIGADDVITLDIIQEISSALPQANQTSNNPSATDVNLVPVISKNRTVTKVHVPNGFFVVLSGMIRDTRSRAVNRVPCLGGIPIIGAVNKHKGLQDEKRNLMIFIRPLIIDTEDEYEYLTKRQQDIYIEKEKYRRFWNYEIDEALDFANIKPTDPDEIGCTIK